MTIDDIRENISRTEWDVKKLESLLKADAIFINGEKDISAPVSIAVFALEPQLLEILDRLKRRLELLRGALHQGEMVANQIISLNSGWEEIDK